MTCLNLYNSNLDSVMTILELNNIKYEKFSWVKGTYIYSSFLLRIAEEDERKCLELLIKLSLIKDKIPNFSLKENNNINLLCANERHLEIGQTISNRFHGKIQVFYQKKYKPFVAKRISLYTEANSLPF